MPLKETGKSYLGKTNPQELIRIHRLAQYCALSFTFLLLFVIQNKASWAQSGNPFITNYELSKTIVDNQNWAITQDNDEVMLFANRRGILAFDGVAWELIPGANFPHAIQKDERSGRIYVGGRHGFGFLNKDNRGKYHYIPIVEHDPQIGSIVSMHITLGYAWFYSPLSVSKIDLQTQEISAQWFSEPGLPFTGMMVHEEEVFVNVDKLGLHRLETNRYTPIQNGEYTAEDEILFSTRFELGTTLIGTDASELFTFNGSIFEPYVLEAQDYLYESVLSGGMELSRDRLALATLTGGCLIIQKSTKKTVYTLNYQTGLPDDEIYAMGKDMLNGLWLSHEFGISRVDLSLPIRTYSSYPGLEGNLISCIQFAGTTFVSTSEGLFYLDEVQNFEEIEILVKKPVNKAEPTLPEQVVVEEVIVESPTALAALDSTEGKTKVLEKWRTKREQRKKNKGRLKLRRKNRHAVQAIDTVPTSTDSSTTAITTTPAVQPTPPREKKKKRKRRKSQGETEYISKQIYALQSISHVFKKVEGLDEKCKQLIPIDDRLLVATNTGLYQVKDNVATPVAPGHYVNFIGRSRVPYRFYAGTSNSILILNLNPETDEWIVSTAFEDFHHSIYSIVEDDRNHLWLGAENLAVYLPIDNNGVPLPGYQSYDFDSDYSEQVLIRKVYGQVFFFLASGVYTYDGEQDKIVYSELLNKNFTPNSKYIIAQENITWIFNTQEWVSLYDHAPLNPNKKIYLDLFDGVKNIYVDDLQNMWVVDQHNELYKILATDQEERTHPFNIYIRTILSDTGAAFELTDLVLDYEHNSLTFNLSAPYYVKLNSVEYQYYVEGLMRDWSRWSANPAVDLPYIPSGDYTLRVRARNVLGHQTQEQNISFTITPPIWEAGWFRSLIILLAIGGIWLLFKLRLRAMRRQRRVLEERVKVRTIQVREQKERVEELLLSILPKKIADELSSKGKAVPRYYDLSTVLFTDFKGFTKISEATTPEELIKTLDQCFSAFDEIVGRWRVEKIKTMGDAYMCAGGVPEQNEYHPLLVTLAAMEINEYMELLKKQRKAANLPVWELRVGINTGPLIAGVVGKKKFAYDVWGDTVNTAARLESASEPGKINVSESTYAYIKKYFICTSRGEIHAKNKGLVSMYFVDRIKPEYALDDEGKKPNPKLLKLLGINPQLQEDFPQV